MCHYSTRRNKLELHCQLTSTSTELASRFSGVPLLEDENGVLVRQLNKPCLSTYECSFWFLNCCYVSEDQEEWRTHCLSHFEGEDPPKSILCPLCDFQGTWEDGWTAWDARQSHLSDQHFSRGETLKTSRPDFHLFQHLWQKRLIEDQDLKELKGGTHNLTRPPLNLRTMSTPLRRSGLRERDRRRQMSHHVSRSRHSDSLISDQRNDRLTVAHKTDASSKSYDNEYCQSSSKTTASDMTQRTSLQDCTTHEELMKGFSASGPAQRSIGLVNDEESPRKLEKGQYEAQLFHSKGH